MFNFAHIKTNENINRYLKDNVYIIAEIGQNHQGNLNIAKQMIIESKNAGCHCAKFQKSHLTTKFTEAALNRIYDSENSWGKTYGEHKNYLEFSIEQFKELKNFCKEIGIDFTASAMDEISLSELAELNLPFIKIGSGDANNYPLILKAAQLSQPLIISIGMQSMSTIEEIVEAMKNAKKSNFAIMHCVSAYPTAPEHANLRTITLLQNRFPDVTIGYSGHEIGLDISKVAVLLGARIIERHLTLDKTLKGSDHKCSLEPKEFKQLVNDIKVFKENNLLKKIYKDTEEIYSILGQSISVEKALKKVDTKIVLPCEMNCKLKLGKSIVAARNLLRGEKLEKNYICIKVSEPNGIPAEKYTYLLGAKFILKNDVKFDMPIQYEDIEENKL